MKILGLIIIFTALLIGMFIKLEHGDATRDQILSGEQKAKLKDAMKPPY